MTIQTAEDLAKLQHIGKIVANTIKLMGESLEPSMTTQELDEIGRHYLTSQGARSAPELTYGFPGATCISINHEVAHGIPSDKKIQAGDLVNIDVSAEKNGYFADSGFTFVVPPVTQKKLALTQTCQLALKQCLAKVRAGLPINVIGKIISSCARVKGYSVIENLGSHGVGRALHEEPEFIAPYYDRHDKRLLQKGMVITIEPFFSTGASYAEEADDGWTLAIPEGYLAAQFEHSLVITEHNPIILTR
jgi:methionyl aminopeptidase